MCILYNNMVGPRQLYLPSISYSLSEMLCLNKHNGEYNYGFSKKNSIVIHVMTHRNYRRNIEGFTDCHADFNDILKIRNLRIPTSKSDILRSC